MRRTDERGMTLVELMIVVVLSGFILLAMYEVMITNQRTYAAQNADAQAQQTLRAGMSVLFSEFREISPGQGDIVTMGSTGILIRALRDFGIVCSVENWGASPEIRVRKIGDYISDGDSVAVFADNDPQDDGDDVWKYGEVQNQDTGGYTCSGTDEAYDFEIDGTTAGPPPDSIVRGAPVRSFERYAYYLGTYDGEPFLVRQDEDGTVDPLVGPLAPGGVSFRYLDADGNTTSDPAQVRQIVARLRTEADVRGPDGELMRDSLTARISTRN